MIDIQIIEEYQKFFDTFNSFEIYLYFLDLESGDIYVSQHVADLFGYTQNKFNKNWKKTIHPDDLNNVINWQKELKKEKQNGKPNSIRYRIIRSDGETRWVENHMSPVVDLFGQVYQYIGLLIDITEQKGIEKKIEYLAFHDTLTGLPNRNIFNEYINKALSRGKRKGIGMALLYLDLDRFKVINDTMGHDIGDEVLKLVAERLLGSVRDIDIVSRQGGDEFIILLDDADVEKSVLTAQRILYYLKEPLLIGEEETYVTASIGISLYPVHGEDAETLIRKADEAMFMAKENGTNLYCIYHKDMQNKIVRRMQLEQALKKAIDNNELSIYYQPIINFSSGDIIGMEALLRWQHPDYGMIQPTEFIPIAEESGQIFGIGEWVLENACKKNKQWQDTGFIPFKIIVNVSNKQFKQKNFIEMVRGILDRTGLDPFWLEIDISEGFLLDIDEAVPITKELEKLGVRVSVDDFGTGIFSFSVFNRLTIEYLKIGRNLVQDIDDTNTLNLIKAIIQMGKSLNLKILVEGIEKIEDIEFFKAQECFCGQGNFYSPPVSAEKAEIYLRNFFEWKAKYGGNGIDSEKVKMIENENKRLKQILAEYSLREA